MNPHDNVHHWIDFASLGVVLATLLDKLPHATALLSFIWVLIRIWETDTVQRMMHRPPRARGKNK